MDDRNDNNDNTKTTIKIFENLKIYEVDASDTHLKKFTLKTFKDIDGRLEVSRAHELLISITRAGLEFSICKRKKSRGLLKNP